MVADVDVHELKLTYVVLCTNLTDVDEFYNLW